MKILPDLRLGPDYISSNTWMLAYLEGYEAQNKFIIPQTSLLHYRYLVTDKDIVRFIDPAIALHLLNKELWVPSGPFIPYFQPFASYDADIN